MEDHSLEIFHFIIGKLCDADTESGNFRPCFSPSDWYSRSIPFLRIAENPGESVVAVETQLNEMLSIFEFRCSSSQYCFSFAEQDIRAGNVLSHYRLSLSEEPEAAPYARAIMSSREYSLLLPHRTDVMITRLSLEQLNHQSFHSKSSEAHNIE